MRRRTYLRTVGAAALTGFLAGCSGDGDGDTGGDGNGTTDTGGDGNGNTDTGGDGNGTTDTGGDGTADGQGTQVAAGPNNDYVFEPESVTVSTGDTVTWTFESPGHNVECDPEQSDYASMPEDAEPFASYEGDNRFGTNEQGTTYEYTFEVAGTYDYVCTPHANQGMRGTVVVEE